MDAEASLQLPGSSMADAQGSKCDPQTPPFAVAKGPSGQRIRVGADDRWRGLARWKSAMSPPYRRHRSASPFRGLIQGAEAWIRAPRPPASASPPPAAGLEAAGRHQGQWSVGVEAPRVTTPSHSWIKAGNHQISWRRARIHAPKPATRPRPSSSSGALTFVHGRGGGERGGRKE
jgi:hypothetical protein